MDSKQKEVPEESELPKFNEREHPVDLGEKRRDVLQTLEAQWYQKRDPYLA